MDLINLWDHVSQAHFTLGLIGLVFGILIFSQMPPDIVLVGAVVLLLLVGVLTPHEALAGMSNEGMITVAVLFIVGAAVRETGGVDVIAKRFLGRPKNAVSAISRLMLPTATLSAFMNNTPLVAMLIPTVGDWPRTNRLPVSKLMIPLSYASILGGTCTLIGSSTNLVVQGLLIQETGKGLRMFDITWVGLPAAIVGILYILVFSRWLLPNRGAVVSAHGDLREYTVEMQVAGGGPLAGKSIEAAGLRHLPGVYLAAIDRDNAALPAVSPQEILRGGDRLLFVGMVESVVDLQRIRGLMPATDQVKKLDAPRAQRCLIEAVVSNTCPLVGKTIRAARFRNLYDAVVVAVGRNGERLHQKIGDIALEPGDTLLIEAHPSFADQQKNSRDFLLVSRMEQSTPPQQEKALLAVCILMGMVVAASLEWLSMLKAAMLAAGLLIFTRCISTRSARQSVDWSVLIAIAASFALGAAVDKSGAAKSIADSTITLAQGNPWTSLSVIYLVTLVATELITNNAAAALMFPFAIATANNLRVDHLPFVIAVMMAASAGFATPIGYQTNLMVYGPGGYRFADYVKMGIPLDILIGVVTVALAPLIWPF